MKTKTILSLLLFVCIAVSGLKSKDPKYFLNSKEIDFKKSTSTHLVLIQYTLIKKIDYSLFFNNK